MREVIGIFAGVLLSGGVSLGIGLVLFRHLAIRLERAEYVSIAFVTGSACFSQVIFALSSIHLARKSVFVAIAVSIAAVACFNLGIPQAFRPALMSRKLRWLIAAIFTSFAIVYLVNALAPEVSPDGAAYHLPFVDRYLLAHGFTPIANDFYASLSQGIELLFLPAVSLGGHSAAALLHFLFLLDLPLMMICFGRRFGFPLPAAAAAFLVFASPIVGWDGTSAYVDVAAAAVVFAVFYLLQIWDSTREANLLLLAGILAGFSYAVKYTAAIAIPYAFLYVTWRLWRGRKPLLRPLLTVAVPTAIFVLPWILKNLIETGNPFAPFANHLFPNPYVHISAEQEYRTYLRHYHLTSWLTAPWELTVKGERLQGFFGPVFLLVPLALVSLRHRTGRRLMLAGTVFALPWCLNIGSRFLIPALPPLSLALALALERPLWILPSLMVIHGFLSWYASPLRYFDCYAPRILTVPWRAALRIEPEEQYLVRTTSGYLIDRMVELQVPPDRRVFSFEPVAKAWTTREVLNAQAGAANEVLADILRTAMQADAMRALNFRFPPALLRRARATQTASRRREMWSVSEFQLLQHGRPLTFDAKWRTTAYPNPWDVRLAFDSNALTRWRSWEDTAPGMYLEADLGEPKSVDQITILVSSDEPRSHLILSGMDTGGAWRTFPAPASITTAHLDGNLREQAVRAIRARGIDYLLVTPSAFGANDFNENAAEWGIRLVGESQGTRLYQLDPDHTTSLPGASAVVSDAPVPPGTYDDADPRMHLSKPWTHDPQFQEAECHTLTYSNIPGASASLTFRGNAVTYVYTRAMNRGIVEVWIDGKPKGHVDLYGPQTVWRCQHKVEALGDGVHRIELRVTGQRNPAASGTYVDLDALIVE